MISVARCAGLLLLFVFLTGSGTRTAGGPSALKEVEGTVLEVGMLAGEGGLELVTVRLSAQQSDAALDLLLAPPSVLQETGFSVTSGDRIRARIFTADGGPATVHKVKNLSEGSMIRLRTLRQIPLWDGAGRWQGGPGLGAGVGRGGLQGPRQGQRGGSGPPH
jgi:hypothetical protein